MENYLKELEMKLNKAIRIEKLKIIDNSSPLSADNKIAYNNEEFPNWLTKNRGRDVADTTISEEFIMNLFEGKKTLDEIHDILFVKLPMTDFILNNYEWHLTYIHKRLQMIKYENSLKNRTNINRRNLDK